DADSLNLESGKRKEGLYFTWTRGELEQALGAEDAAEAASYWSVDETGDLDGRNVLRIAGGQTPNEIDSFREKLRATRSERPAPLRDDKIVAAWNGLAVSAFAQAAFAFEEPAYAD